LLTSGLGGDSDDVMGFSSQGAHDDLRLAIGTPSGREWELNALPINYVVAPGGDDEIQDAAALEEWPPRQVELFVRRCRRNRQLHWFTLFLRCEPSQGIASVLPGTDH
jgi:hypothetical protein